MQHSIFTDWVGHRWPTLTPLHSDFCLHWPSAAAHLSSWYTGIQHEASGCVGHSVPRIVPEQYEVELWHWPPASAHIFSWYTFMWLMQHSTCNGCFGHNRAIHLPSWHSLYLAFISQSPPATRHSSSWYTLKQKAALFIIYEGIGG